MEAESAVPSTFCKSSTVVPGSGAGVVSLLGTVELGADSGATGVSDAQYLLPGIRYQFNFQMCRYVNIINVSFVAE